MTSVEGPVQYREVAAQNRLLAWAMTSALAGFLFGFDTIVISGAEQTIQKLWELSDAQHGWAMSAALWGTVLGSFVGGWPTDRFGRKPTLLWIGILYFVSAVWSGLATGPYSFMVARFLGGLGVGISTVAAPLFISEIAPPERRGRLAGMFQFNIVFGILVAFVSNYFIGKTGEHAWRWMLGVEAIPALIYTLLCFSLPESPRWLILHQGDREAGTRVLRMVNPGARAADIETLADEIAASAVHRTTAAGFWSSKYRVPILLAFLIAFFNQMSGINAILYFAPRIFGLAGFTDPLKQSIGLGITNLVFTFIGLRLIDGLGRRTLLFIGSLGYIASLGLAGWAFLTYAPQFDVAAKAIDVSKLSAQWQQADEAKRDALEAKLGEAKALLLTAAAEEDYGGPPVEIPSDATVSAVGGIADRVVAEASRQAAPGGTVVLICILAFIAAHAVGQGAVIWVFISEIFPNEQRAYGQALGSFTHWIMAAMITLLFPMAVNRFAPGAVLLFFCFMMVLQLLWVTTMVPETKGVPLEEIQNRLGID